MVSRHENRVLINVHGGAFMGAGSAALVESISIATTMGIRVVAVAYRLASENCYSAVWIDFTAVMMRCSSLSGCEYRQLRLFLLEELPYAFFIRPQMPEAHNVYRIVAAFFDKKLRTEAKQKP